MSGREDNCREYINMPREKPPKPEELIERLEEKVPMNLFIILTITIIITVIIIIINILTLLTLTRWLRSKRSWIFSRGGRLATYRSDLHMNVGRDIAPRRSPACSLSASA